MKRLTFFLLILSLLLLPVYATENNEFFNLHAADCVYDGREYLVNDPKGYLSVLDAPDGKVQDHLFNEQSLIVYGIYTDASGTSWAELRYTILTRGAALSEVEGQYIGWAPLSSLYRAMDASDFLALHEEEFVNRPMRFRNADYPDTTLWASPLAEKPCGYLRWYVHEEDTLLSFPAWWEDSDGQRWALWDDAFICLTDPQRTAPTAPDATVFYPSVSPDALPLVVEEPVIPERPSLLPYYLIGISLVLTALSLVLRKFTNNQNERK